MKGAVDSAEMRILLVAGAESIREVLATPKAVWETGTGFYKWRGMLPCKDKSCSFINVMCLYGSSGKWSGNVRSSWVRTAMAKQGPRLAAKGV